MISTLQSNVKSPKKLVEDAELSGELRLRNRKIKNLALCVSDSDLSDVTTVDCSFNCLNEVPVQICEWYCIQLLDLSHNYIKTIPEFLTTLCLLEVLDLSNNQITHLPLKLSELKAITSLHLQNNKIVSLPSIIGKLKQCQMLNISGNELNTLPNEIGNMSSLKHLDVSRNSLYSLPEEISLLELVHLDASSNKISTIPASYQTMHLQIAMFDYNPLVSPPLSSLKKGRVHMFKSMQNESLKNQRQKEFIEPLLARKRDRVFSKAMDYSLTEMMENMYTENVNKQNMSLMSGNLITTNTVSPIRLHAEVLPENGRDNATVKDVTKLATVNGNGMHTAVDGVETVADKSTHGDLVKEHVQDNDSQQSSVKSKRESPLKLKQESAVKSSIQSPIKFRQSSIKYRDSPNKSLDNAIKSKETPIKSKEIPLKFRESPVKLRESSARSRESTVKSRENSAKARESPIKVSRESSMKSRKDGAFKSKIDPSGINKPKRESFKSSTSSSTKKPMIQKPNSASTKSTPVTYPGYTPGPPIKQKPKRRTPTHSPTDTSEKTNYLDVIRSRSASANHKMHSSTDSENDTSFTMRRKTEKIYEELELLEQLRNGIESTLKMPLPQDLLPALTDGVVLCHLANHVKSRSISTIHVPSPAVPKLSLAKCRRNVDNFLEACSKLGVEKSKLCSYNDIMQGKGLSRILTTVNELLDLVKPINVQSSTKRSTSFSTPTVRIAPSLVKQKSYLHSNKT